MTSIRVDYKPLIKNYREFENKLRSLAEQIITLDHTHSNDLQLGQHQTSYESWLIAKKENIDISKEKNLIDFKRLNLNATLIRFVMEMFPWHSITITGHFFYPPGGFMSWHTNNNDPGTRVYISVVDALKKSQFNYIENDNLINDVDDEKIIVRKFICGDEKNPFWHSVYSECNRISFGFNLHSFK
jgi:hypothetical protein